MHPFRKKWAFRTPPEAEAFLKGLKTGASLLAEPGPGSRGFICGREEETVWFEWLVDTPKEEEDRTLRPTYG